ncbi:MAG: hypothetical protein NZ901_10175 [Geminocystis sp.]|nr:hypothetical protein [Geminocystis sp.]HIK36897.1 hypothetical protein [Geminocystis sp. M7585_C2015_104]MCS7148541.1 hypothetical protein [Geminocystis sp.]MCX8079497.1 hypothetical protein [Geminocystis sp.]MDW8114886.1 hypothetical protein [Geminocystis sp.]
MTVKSGLLLMLCCVASIAMVGCLFELGSGMPDLGQTNTILILAASVPTSVVSFVLAVKDARANLEK